MSPLDTASMDLDPPRAFGRAVAVPRPDLALNGLWWKLPLVALMLAAAVPAVAVGAVGALVAGAAMLAWRAVQPVGSRRD